MKYLLIRCVGALALLFGCLAATPGGAGTSSAARSADKPPEKWLRLEYLEGRFRIRMPAMPHIHKVASETEYRPQECVLYVCEGSNGDRFLVSFIDFPAEAFRDGPQRVLRETRRGLLEAVRGKVVSERRIELAGHPGLEAEIETPGGDIQVWRAFVVNGRVYQLLTGVKGGKGISSPTVRPFLDSFALL